MKNNNRHVIQKLSKKSFRSNKLRNLFAIVAIVLTTTLFTSVFTMGLGLVKATEQETMRQVGTSAHAGFKDLTRKEYDQIKSNKGIQDIAYNVLLGTAENKELEKRRTELRYGEDKVLKWGSTFPETGNTPKSTNDVLVDTIVLDMMGLPHEIGTAIEFRFEYYGTTYQDTFRVCGIYEGDPMLGASQIYFSKEYADQVIERVEENQRKEKVHTGSSNGEGLTQAYVYFEDSNNIEEKAKKILEECGFAENEIEVGVNWAYLSTQSDGMDVQSLIGLGALFLLIGFTGYLVIYNIFQISIVTDIRFYGLLKTIGTTKRQIRSLVRRQALLLSAIGVPVGLLVGWVLGIQLTPLMLKITNGTAGSGFTANPVIFVGAAVFSLVTVIISCNKPSKIAANVSPVEAVKYVEGSQRNKRKSKKSNHGGKLYKMAFSNIFRNRRKTMVVVSSMTLSMILLLVVYSMVTGFSVDQYLDDMITGDLNIGTSDYFNNYGAGDIQLPDDYEQFVSSLEGIQESGKGYLALFPYFLDEKGKISLKDAFDNGFKSDSDPIRQIFQNLLEEDSRMYESRLAFDDYILKSLEVLEGEIDLEKFKSGDYVIEAATIGMDNGQRSYHHPGDKIKLKYYDQMEQYQKMEAYDQATRKEVQTGENAAEYNLQELPEKEYEVMAVVKLGAGIGRYLGVVPDFTTIVPKTELDWTSQINGSFPFIACYQVLDERKEEVNRNLESYTKTINPEMDYRSRETLKEEFMQISMMIGVIGGILCAVVALVGILNYINSTLTGIITRRRELAMLKSIGMTEKQQIKLLIIEGAYYIAFTAGVSIVAGTLVSLVIVRGLSGIVRWFVYQFTLTPILLCIPILLLIAVLAPVFMYRTISSTSIVERLRE